MSNYDTRTELLNGREFIIYARRYSCMDKNMRFSASKQMKKITTKSKSKR